LGERGGEEFPGFMDVGDMLKGADCHLSLHEINKKDKLGLKNIFPEKEKR